MFPHLFEMTNNFHTVSDVCHRTSRVLKLRESEAAVLIGMRISVNDRQDIPTTSFNPDTQLPKRKIEKADLSFK